MQNFTYSIKTMGCKANVYDSLIIEQQLRSLGGIKSFSEEADIFVLNSCTVTNEADKQAHREVNSIKKKNSNVLTLVTGCYAQVNPEQIKLNTNVDWVVQNTERSKIRSLLSKHFNLNIPETAEEDTEVFWGQLPTQSDKTRAFLKIQEGCNDFCTYCIIPYARGKSRSVELLKIIDEINRLVMLGVQEVVLTGTNIADYGKDLGLNFEDLIEEILNKTNLQRLRLTSLDPSEITERILLILKENNRLMPHFHISLQSANSRVLRAMKRDYRQEEVVSALSRIQKTLPDIFVGMDVIAGFPGETLEEHEDTLSLLRSTSWTRLHVFPYSEREGTPALKIKESVPVQERKRRAQELMLLSKEKHQKFIEQFLNKKINGVLVEEFVESDNKIYAIGHTKNYIRILCEIPNQTMQSAKASYKNKIISVFTESASPKPSQDWTLEGRLILEV